MRKYELLFFVLAVAMVSVPSMANAQYWFQFGARAGSAADFNYGAGTTIQTVLQNVSLGSLGFWAGETLSNGAFLQIGYTIENQSGSYPALCTSSGCTNDENITAGNAEWFYEYFLPGQNSSFLGGLGPDGSVGPNGSFHTYSFYSIGNTWYFVVDGNVVGSVDLRASDSGANMPVAFGELANAATNTEHVSQVIFDNFSVYLGGRRTEVPIGYSYIGYGVGSSTGLPNLYGVEELNNKVNYFAVGSGLPQPQNHTQLWSLGYHLLVKSQYANISSNTSYLALSNVVISAPRSVQVNGTTRAIFYKWIGRGTGSYTGPMNNVTVLMGGNITETAEWTTQYLVNVSTEYGSATGSGWYNASSPAAYGIGANQSQLSPGTRVVFTGWSTGNKNESGSIRVSKPEHISAVWQRQYLLNVSSDFGNVTGGGWYANNTLVTVSESPANVTVSQTERYTFTGWSNGNASAATQLLVTSPTTIEAIFVKQYLVRFITENAYGSPINSSNLYLNSKPVGSVTFINADQDYNLTGATYDGVQLSFKSPVYISAPTSVQVKLPVYNVKVSASDLFGLPVAPVVYVISTSNTQNQTYDSQNGVMNLSNLPYGYVKGTASYLGVTQDFTSRGGYGVNMIFVSLANIIAFVLVIVAILSAYIISKRHYESRPPAQQSQNR